MYNQHPRGMATTRHMSLVERGGRKALLENLHTKKKQCQEKTDIPKSKGKDSSRASSKATRLFFIKVIKETSINVSNLVNI